MKILSNHAEVVSNRQRTLALLHKNRTIGNELKNRLIASNYQVRLFRSVGRLLNYLDRHAVQSVLVDLHSPDESPVDIARIRERFPLVPILALADQANTECLKNSLFSGANHFVLDQNDRTSLTSTLERLITFRMEHIRYIQVMPYLKTRLEASIPSELELLGGVVFYLTEELFKHGLISLNEVNVKVAIIEALTNAMEHGNGLDPKKKVHIQADYDRDRAVIQIVDEGQGFDIDSLPDPTDEKNIYRPRGRGIFMMRQFMDEVIFHPPGNHLTLIKKRATENVLSRPYPWERRMV